MMLTSRSSILNMRTEFGWKMPWKTNTTDSSRYQQIKSNWNIN